MLVNKLQKIGFDGNGINARNDFFSKDDIENYLNLQLDNFHSESNSYGGTDYRLWDEELEVIVVIEIFENAVHDVFFDC